MQLKEITARLKGVKGGGTQYTALCPAHADKNPSLAISEKDGKVLLHCHAGCSTESIVSALGFEMKDLFTEERPSRSGISNNKPKREIAAVYDYKDLDGNIVHSTVRYNPKSFSQRRPDSNKPGEYIWKEVFKGITSILYNLQAVKQAIEDKRPVFIVEGEKDCETLAKLGFTATTCPMGASKWRKEYSEVLKGGTVYIIVDNDETGNKHAENVAKSLVGIVDEMFIIDLTKIKPEAMTEIPQGYDISDFIDTTSPEQRKSAILELIANSTEYIADKPSKGVDGSLLGGSGKPTAAQMLMSLVEESGATFFHSEVNDFYATMRVNGHNEIMAIESRAFELWLIGLYYNGCGKPISSDAIKQVLGACSAKAMYNNPTPVKLSALMNTKKCVTKQKMNCAPTLTL